jgi:hypothetical protein
MFKLDYHVSSAGTMRVTLVLTLCALSLVACSKRVKTYSLPPPGTKIDSCSLLTKEEVGEIQQAPMTGAQSSDSPSSEFVASQCYYASSTPNCSVSIVVIQRDPAKAGGRSIEQYWNESFARFHQPKDKEAKERREEAERNEHKGEAEEEGERQHVDAVPQLGDEAYWNPSPIGGILYVRQGEKMFRLSVGGPGTNTEKLEKSKKLAERAIARLPK